MDGSREAKKKKMLVAFGFPRTLHFSSMLSIGWFLSQAGFFLFFPFGCSWSLLRCSGPSWGAWALVAACVASSHCSTDFSWGAQVLGHLGSVVGARRLL